MYKESKLPHYILNILNNFSLDSKILDYGCGFGHTLRELKKHGYANSYGADISSEAISFVQSLGFDIFDCSKTAFDSLDRKPLKNILGEGQYDLIIMSHVLEHIKKEHMIEFLSELRDCLNEHGKLLIMVPNAQSPIGCYWAYEDFTHEYLFTSGSLYYVLRAAGFNDIQFVDIECESEHGILRKVLRRVLLKVYKLKLHFWNIVTCTWYHGSSPIIVSLEIKALACK